MDPVATEIDRILTVDQSPKIAPMPVIIIQEKKNQKLTGAGGFSINFWVMVFLLLVRVIA